MQLKIEHHTVTVLLYTGSQIPSALSQNVQINSNINMTCLVYQLANCGVR